jgi:hypothetical protein
MQTGKEIVLGNTSRQAVMRRPQQQRHKREKLSAQARTQEQGKMGCGKVTRSAHAHAAS